MLKANKDSNSIAIFEGDRAKNYDSFVENWIPNYNYFINLLPKLLENVEEKNALVVGCGTGNEILRLAEESQEWSFTGVDPSPEMISIAKEKLASHTDIILFNGRLEDLKNRQPFGVATLILVLHFVKYPNQKLKLIKEIYRRLKPGSPFIIMGIFGTGEQLVANLKVLRQLLPESLEEKEIDERFDRIQNELHRTSEEELTKLLIRAGFETPTRFFQTSIYSGWITKKL